MSLPRISRPCYDKAHRCPGWAGGGMRYASTDLCPDGGRVAVPPSRRDPIEAHDPAWPGTHPGAAPLRLARCNACPVIVLPYAVRWVDPTWLRWRVSFAVRSYLTDRRSR